MRTNLKRSALALACVLGMSGVAAAHAAGDDAADENPSRSEAVELERVVATAQKRVENVGEVPMAISVISEDRLETLNAGRLTDYAAYVPGFQVDSGGAPGVTSMSLRGLAPMGGGAIIGTYIDDTPVNPSNNKNRAGSYVLDMLPYDLESVEILRGPQGTLYGASSMGGLFKYITRAADTENHEFRAGMDVSTVSGAGDLGTGVRAAANFPLKEGRLGMRVSVARQTTPGYVDETNLGEKDANGYVQEAARLAFKLNITDNASLRLQGLWQKVDADSLAQVGLDPDTLQPVAGRLDGNAYVRAEAGKAPLVVWSPARGRCRAEYASLEAFRKATGLESRGREWTPYPGAVFRSPELARFELARRLPGMEEVPVAEEARRVLRWEAPTHVPGAWPAAQM